MAKDAVNLLDADHTRVESLFNDFKAADLDPATRLDIAQVICMELTLHAMVEEERSGMFAKARASNMDLFELGRKLEIRKYELTATIHQAA